MTQNPQPADAGTPADPSRESTGQASSGQNTAAPAAQAPPLPVYKRPLFWSLLLLLLLLALLGWLIHTQMEKAREREQAYQAELDAAKQQNAAREAYLQQLRDLLRQEPCVIKERLAVLPPPPPGLSLPDPLLPGTAGEQQTPRPQADAPSQEPPAASSPDTSGPAVPPASVAQLLEQGTVLVLAMQGQGLSQGSGFFISRQHVLTNGHVVGDAREAVIINKATAKVVRAAIRHRVQNGSQDFAVLELAAPAPITPLSLCFSVQRTEKVSAWGFPGAVTHDDPQFRALLEGNASAVPEVVYSEGAVNVVQQHTPPLIIHSATVSQGSSGGPLVNTAGQVVGINTFIKLDDVSYHQSSIAVVSTEIARVLKQWGIAYVTATNAPPATGSDAAAESARPATAPAPKGAPAAPASGLSEG